LKSIGGYILVQHVEGVVGDEVSGIKSGVRG